MTQIVDCIDNLEALPAMDAGCIDAIVTDPPYGLAFMGKSWDKTLPDRRTWSELLRVLKPGGHAVIFGAPRLYHRLAVDVEDAGFEIRDCLMWLYGSGFPKSKNLDGEWQGWGTALKPAWEPAILARKPLVGTIATNVLTHGTGALNIDGCRIGGGVERKIDNYPSKGPQGSISHGVGKGHAGDEYTTKTVTCGRWPANIILDDGPEEWRRYFYCAKASRSEREAGLQADDGKRANTHPTVKPVALMRWLVRLVTPPGGLVLDPFCGSGSTGVACVYEGVRFLGLELDAGYAEIARARIAHANGPLLR